MTPRMLAQLGFVATFDAEAISRDDPGPAGRYQDRYGWPPRSPLSDEERVEIERLLDVAGELFARAEAGGWSGGTDSAFTG